LGEGPHESGDILVSAIWLTPDQADIDWENLVSAFESYSLKHYQAALVPANTAVEARLAKLINAAMKPRVPSSKKLGDFLQGAATYSHQLNILLPLLVDLAGAPKLSNPIRGQLNKLRRLRNAFSHEGRLEHPLGDGEAAELMCSSLFAFEYLRLVAPLLVPKTEAE
jgi:hypothetical protein